MSADDRTVRDWTGDPIWMHGHARQATPQTETPSTEVRRLLGPDGKTIRTFSDKPPVGFHQGERGR